MDQETKLTAPAPVPDVRTVIDDFAIAALPAVLADAIERRWQTNKPWDNDAVGILAYQAALGCMKARKHPELWGPPL